MNFKVHHLFMMLSIIPREILSIKTVDNEFNTFVQNLIINQFNASTYIGIFHNTKGIRHINLPQILESLQVPVIVHDLITPRIIYRFSETLVPNQAMLLTNSNIIFIENSKQFRSMLEVAVSNPFFSARTNMLVILTERVLGTEKWIRKIFSQLWQEYILNVGLVFYNGKINLLTYIPWTSPQKIENLTDQGISANIFYDKLKNLCKYPIKILRNIYDSTMMIAVTKKNSTTYLGVDGMTMSTILEYHNATSNIVLLDPASFKKPCRFVHYNYTIQGLFGADVRNRSISSCPFSLRLPTSLKRPSELDIIPFGIDVYFNSRPLRFDMDYRVDTSSFQRRDNYCILIPAEHKIPQLMNLTLPLQKYVWLAIVLNFILYTTIHFGIQILNKNNKKSLFDTCLVLYRIQMNSVTQDPNNSRPLENASLFCWILYSFLISAAYQSVLISFIIAPFYDPPINSLEELRKIDIPIFATLDILADMPNTIDRVTSEIILPKIKLELQTPRKFDSKNGYLVLESKAHQILQLKNFIDQDGRPLFHLMTECPMPLFTTYLMPRGSPLLQIINKFTSRRRESGLEQVWEDTANRFINSRVITHIEYGEKRIRLTVSHLQGAFYILIIGEVGAISVFLSELCWNRIKRFSLSLPCNHSHIRSL